MPRVLILYASLGAGHGSAAHALAAALARLGARPRVEDVLDYASSVVRATVTRAHHEMELSEQGQQFYRVIYERSNEGDIAAAFRQNRLLGLLTRPFLTRLDRLFAEAQPDAVVSIHPVAGCILALRRQQGRLNAPLYVVITDFLAHSSWLAPGVRRYFLASSFTRWTLERRGLAPELLEVTGIPISLDFAQPKQRADARVRRDLPVDGAVIALFGGGIEARRVRLVAEELLTSEMPGMLVTVAGRNAELHEALRDLRAGPSMGLRRLGRIDYVDDLMVASDVVITKAGGLIVSEALARHAPLVIVDPLPGHEEWNADFVTSVGAGIQLRLPEMAARAALVLLQQPERLAAMRQQAATVAFPEAALSIGRRIVEDCGPAHVCDGVHNIDGS